MDGLMVFKYLDTKGFRVGQKSGSKQKFQFRVGIKQPRYKKKRRNCLKIEPRKFKHYHFTVRLKTYPKP